MTEVAKPSSGPYISLLLWSSVASHERSWIAGTAIYLMSRDINCITSGFWLHQFA